MLTVERTKTITKLALPVVVALGSTLTMELIDLAMVGRLGDTAIAAVGLSIFSGNVVFAFMTGITFAVQGIVARSRGEGSQLPAWLPLRGGIVIALLAGTPLTILAYLLTPFLFSLTSSDPAVTKIGVSFLRTLLLAIIPIGIHASFKGYWAGIKRTRIYMVVVLFMNCVNAIMNYALIFGHFGLPALGPVGAAIATLSACVTGVLVNCIYFDLPKTGFWAPHSDWSLLGRITKLALPETMGDFMSSVGFVVFFWMVGQVGTPELAAASILIRILVILNLLPMALGVASATLVGQSIGAGDPAQALQWGWDTGKLGIVALSLLGLPLVGFPRACLSVFLTDPHTISIATVPLQLAGSIAGIGSLIYIFGYTLYSSGDGNRVVIVSFFIQWIFFLPAVWIVGPYLHHGLLQIWLVLTAYVAIGTILITAIWIDGKWKTVKL